MNQIGITARDLFHLKSVTDPKLSPDGSMAVYVQTGIDEKTEKYISNLYMFSLITNETKQWTFGDNRDTSPAWSPDGKHIAFISDRSGKKQVHIIGSIGGEARQLTHFINGASTPIWSPCSTKLLLSTGLKEGETLDTVEENQWSKEIHRYDRIKYKWDGRGYFDQSYQQLVIVDVLKDESMVLTESGVDHRPNAWSPDGQHIAFICGDADKSDDELFSDIFTMEVGTKTLQKITDSKGFYTDPKWSPNGEYLSFIGHNKEFAGATHSKIWLYTFIDQTIRCLTDGWDVEIGDSAIGDFQIGAVDPGILWTNDSQGFYFLISDYGNTGVYYGSIEGAMYPSILDAQHIYGLTIDPESHRAVVAISTSVHPGDLFAYNLTNGDKEQISFVNEEFLKDKHLSTAEPISFPASDGLTIHGWIMRPAGFVENQKYPLILEIHGGPHMMYANTYVHEFQTLVNEGYAVLFTNPRGSKGYGQEFVNACRGDYGGMDYHDLMAGVDYALATYDFLNEENLGVSGGSYGGFMTNWIVGHTNRFKAAVTQRCISNWLSFYGVSDIGYYFTEWEIGGDIVHSAEKLWQHSPLKYVGNVDTPLLLLHGERDYRCPVEQSEQFFVALKRQKKEALLVTFPDETHEVSRSGSPKMRLGHIEEIRGWFNKYL
ncbi:S9 family peptidase [Peribacillus muralis]|uniref:S9 family peptidase n=1 Tax=Peribacillus muralis TaxID=264697 RepID=UPI001F4EB294|nr:S9 family peptidase [Peribacillus muralis]MCK1991014.1 S9 family peptidase [Peribacillus muralis]MCK2011568.1 S9 family peptidase [Peribacillus muralis]